MDILIKAATVNWKTTILGVVAILTAIANFGRAIADDDPSTVADPMVLVAAISAGLAMIFARDADKSSQDTGIRPEHS